MSNPQEKIIEGEVESQKVKTDIDEYNEIQAKISELKTEYVVVPACDTKAGLALCKKKYREVRKFEINLDKVRKEKGEAARKHLKHINDAAGEIDDMLKEISGPFKDAYERRELEIKEEEQRIENELRLKIDQLYNFTDEAENTDSAGVQNIIQAFESSVELTEENFGHLLPEAAKAKKAVNTRLAEILQSKTTEELMAKQKAEQAISDYLNSIRMLPVDLIAEDSDRIRSEYDSLLNTEAPEHWNEFNKHQFSSAKTETLNKLDLMHDSTLRMEEIDATEQALKLAELDNAPPKAIIDELLPFLESEIKASFVTTDYETGTKLSFLCDGSEATVTINKEESAETILSQLRMFTDAVNHIVMQEKEGNE